MELNRCADHTLQAQGKKNQLRQRTANPRFSNIKLREDAAAAYPERSVQDLQRSWSVHRNKS